VAGVVASGLSPLIAEDSERWNSHAKPGVGATF
jgi:hypothetical protein